MARSRNRLVDDLAGHIRDRIVGGDLAPGSKFTEQALAEEYSVARPTVRSAIETLVADGLLVRHAHQQPQVPVVAERDVPDILKLLETSETLALERLQNANADLRPIRAALDTTTHNLLNAMVEAADSARLVIVHRRCTFELLLFLRSLEVVDFDPPSEIIRRHRALYGALALGDGSAQRELVTVQQVRRKIAMRATESVGQA